jgi:hypothetical protein
MDMEVTLRFLLLSFFVAIYIMAIFYLRRRPLTPGMFTFWGLFALVIPALGPFLVISLHPGHHARKRGLPPFTSEK